MGSTNRRPSVIGGATRLVGKSVSLMWNTVGVAIYGADQLVTSALNASKTARDDVRAGYRQADATKQLLNGRRKNRRVSAAQQVLREELNEKSDEVLS